MSCGISPSVRILVRPPWWGAKEPVVEYGTRDCGEKSFGANCAKPVMTKICNMEPDDLASQRKVPVISKSSNPARVIHHNALIFMAAIFCELQEREFPEVPCCVMMIRSQVSLIQGTSVGS